ncbi:MAG: septum formation inhibitor Maf [Ruminococcaceae bacterium]|nr:septum formation inhibitor Maf [Oscillospiraceae bacterium]
MKKIILASASPRRKELLQTAGIEFEVCVADVDESIPEGTKPLDAAKLTATKKALATAESHKDDIVIGADTIVVAGDKILGKPKDKADAAAMLRMLSGIEHEVITGVCLVCEGKSESFVKVSKVKFYELTDEEIEAYVATGEPMDKAGSYGIQGKGCTLVEKIEGDYFNIVGLPVAKVVREINKLIK